MDESLQLPWLTENSDVDGSEMESSDEVPEVIADSLHDDFQGIMKTGYSVLTAMTHFLLTKLVHKCGSYEFAPHPCMVVHIYVVGSDAA